MKFKAKLIPSGNATAVEIPIDMMAQLGSGARPLIVISINHHSWRSRVALMRGQALIAISAANRAAAGIDEGDLVNVTVEVDDQPREVELPADLDKAFSKTKAARAAFDKLPFGLRRKHVAHIADAKSPETRARRVDKLVTELTDV